MAKLWILLLMTTLSLLVIVDGQFKFPTPNIEALKSGKVRVAIPHVQGIKLFAFHANINEAIERKDPGDYFKETKQPDGNFWILTFDMPLGKDDIIYYWMYLALNMSAYDTDDYWPVDELKDSFSSLELCKESLTIINGKNFNCRGGIIFEDTFNGPQLDRTKWTVHHKIPTYSGPNYEFNSYLDQKDTCFLKNEKLYLKPIPFENGNDIRGVLNLTDKCTSSKLHECFYSQKSSFILPPVKSAKITSNISFKYGKVEIKAKLPSGDWIVPIIELEDKTESDGENSAKIWIAYSRGNQILKDDSGYDYSSHVLYGGPVLYPAEPIRSKYLATKYDSKPFSDGYHVYTLEWKPGRMKCFVDGEIFCDLSTQDGFAEYSMQVRGDWTEPEAPYNNEYVLSLGVAVGGIHDFPDDLNSRNNAKPWDNTERNYIFNFFEARDTWKRTWHGDNAALQVDYIKITAI